MIHCDKCNRSYKNCNFNKHNCNKKEIKFRVLDTWKDFNTNLYKCPECDKKFSKNGLISHNTIRKWIKYNGGTQLTEVHRLEND